MRWFTAVARLLCAPIGTACSVYIYFNYNGLALFCEILILARRLVNGQVTHTLAGVTAKINNNKMKTTETGDRAKQSLVTVVLLCSHDGWPYWDVFLAHRSRSHIIFFVAHFFFFVVSGGWEVARCCCCILYVFNFFSLFFSQRNGNEWQMAQASLQQATQKHD